MASFGPNSEVLSQLQLGHQYFIRQFTIHENNSDPTNARLQILLRYNTRIEAVEDPVDIAQTIVSFCDIPQMMNQYYK